jgi:hypothetical protein
MKSQSNRLEKGIHTERTTQIGKAKTHIKDTIEQSILKGLLADGLINENEYSAALDELRKFSNIKD